MWKAILAKLRPRIPRVFTPDTFILVSDGERRGLYWSTRDGEGINLFWKDNGPGPAEGKAEGA